jgi:hypothetical protein
MKKRILLIVAMVCLAILVVYGISGIAFVFIANQVPETGEVISGILSLGFAGLLAKRLAE